MGTTQSTTKTQYGGEATQELAKLLESMRKNDTFALVENLGRLNDVSGRVPDEIISRITGAHANIVDGFNNSTIEKGNSSISNLIQNSVNRDIDDKMKGFLDDPAVKQHPEMAASMEDITNNIKLLRGKYKFFEYKYLQMNIFLILFVINIQESLQTCIDANVSLCEQRDIQLLKLVQDVVHNLQVHMGEPSMKVEENATLADSIKQLSNSIMDNIKNHKQIGEKVKHDTMQEMMQFVMKKEIDFATDIVNVVENLTKST